MSRTTEQSAAHGAGVAAVLQHSDRYLLELVERWDICPFAQRCREEGRLWRRIVWADEPTDAGQRIDDAIDTLERQAAAAGPDVALLLCPGLQDVSAADFNAVYAAARARYGDRYAKPSFFVVAFHPRLQLNASSPASLINFWRRSPHPTLQLVSVALLARLRHVDRAKNPDRIALEMAATGATAEEILAALEGQRAHLPISARVAAQNGQTFAMEGAAVFIKAQEGLAGHVAADVARLGPWRATWPDSDWQPTGRTA